MRNLSPKVISDLAHISRLPAPDPISALSILGGDPRNLDGSPVHKKSSSVGAPGSGHNVSRIAHRAAGLDAPENSLEALRLCARNGARCVEFDISFTAEGHAVVFHDDTVDRLTNRFVRNWK